MKKVKTEYPVYVDVNKFFKMNRIDPNTKGGKAIKCLNLEINEGYIARSPLPAPQSQFKEIYFGDREHDTKSVKKTLMFSQSIIEEVKQKPSEEWTDLLCVKNVHYELHRWERSLASVSKHYFLLNKAFLPLPKAVSYEIASSYYDSIGDPYKAQKLEVLANLYTPLKYKNIFNSCSYNQNVDDFQLVLEIFTRRLNACSIYNKKWVFGRSPIPFSQIYGDVVNKDYLILVLKNEIMELENFIKYNKVVAGEIKPVGIHTENPNVLFFRSSPIKNKLVVISASQKLAFLNSIEDLDSRIQALVYYEQARPF